MDSVTLMYFVSTLKKEAARFLRNAANHLPNYKFVCIDRYTVPQYRHAGLSRRGVGLSLCMRNLHEFNLPKQATDTPCILYSTQYAQIEFRIILPGSNPEFFIGGGGG
jgi:hypothetical protein